MSLLIRLLSFARKKRHLKQSIPRGGFMQSHRRIIIWVLFFVFFVGCAPKFSEAPLATPDSNISIPPDVLKERDEIYMLAAYAVVYNDWQDGSGQKRGHNIGSVLVAPNGKIVNWARNCNARLANGTQHGEVRLMVGYLNRVGGYSLTEHTVYTTLEPCAQCSGMMVLTNIKRTVYGQTDPGFGKAIERLKLDSRKWNPAGYPPYPRAVISDRSDSRYCAQLEEAYKKTGGSITTFLLSEQARAIFQAASGNLYHYRLKYPEQNGPVLKDVQDTIARVKPGIPVIVIKPKN
jgi:tRNA(adenine34) deaminase